MVGWNGWWSTRAALGLDIGPSVVKLVELTRHRQGHYTLAHLGRAGLPPGAVVDGQIEDLDRVAAAVREAVQSSGTQARKVVMALPTKNVILRKTKLRADMGEDELAVHVETEAAGFVPFPIDELSLDFSVLGPVPDSPGDVEVLIAAARKDRVQDRLAVAESAGLEPVVIEIESNAAQLALNDWLRRQGHAWNHEAVALVELTDDVTRFKVFRDEDMVFEREDALGGRRLTDRVRQAFQLTEDEARKRQFSGQLPEAYAQHMLPEYVMQSAAEISRLLQFFYASAPSQRLNRVVLSGAWAKLPLLAQRVGEFAEVSTVVVDPFEAIDIGPQVDRHVLHDLGPAYLIACGLALRSFAQ